MQRKWKIGLLITFICFVSSLGFLYLKFNPSLTNMTIHVEGKVDSILSPDGTKRLTIYYNGGLILYTDMTYVGVLEDLITGEEKNLFVVPIHIKNVKWLSNEKISVNNLDIPIDRPYDFRK